MRPHKLSPYKNLKQNSFFPQDDIENSLRSIHDVATRSCGNLCVTENYRLLTVPLTTTRFEGLRQKADLAAALLKDLGIAHHNGEFIFNESATRTTEE